MLFSDLFKVTGDASEDWWLGFSELGHLVWPQSSQKMMKFTTIAIKYFNTTKNLDVNLCFKSHFCNSKDFKIPIFENICIISINFWNINTKSQWLLIKYFEVDKWKCEIFWVYSCWRLWVWCVEVKSSRAAAMVW